MQPWLMLPNIPLSNSFCSSLHLAGGSMPQLTPFSLAKGCKHQSRLRAVTPLTSSGGSTSDSAPLDLPRSGLHGDATRWKWLSPRMDLLCQEGLDQPTAAGGLRRVFTWPDVIFRSISPTRCGSTGLDPVKQANGKM